MARFYDPRRENADQPVDTSVGYRGRLEYDPRQDSGSSGGEVSDLTPERGYDVDLRRLDREERNTAVAADTANTVQQARVSRFFKASKLAEKYKSQADTRYPIIGNETRRNPVLTNFRSFGFPFGGKTLPSLGEAPGARGSVNYPNKPQPRTGRAYNWLDSFA
jgi:hypothetical protein